ncbi:MAG TPA: SUMF1/EgtB/PvdO family nonheme iron enzyme, partial [Anaerolineae bacterium]|nr:SUMF1/EgtB/PvdO family nonheme iron enzyme [Anaerolineae bacterium]
MAFQPTVNAELRIDGVTYHVCEHPLAPGIPYGQEGRQAVVYQLAAGRERRALKVFKSRFRVPGLAFLAEQLAHYAALPGLSVCSRTVLTPQRHPDLLRGNSDLIFAVLMPWIQGPTWAQVLLEKRPLTPEQSLRVARGLAEVLATLEQRSVAHNDLSGPNVLLPELAGGQGVALVDVEQLFAPELRQPEALPQGSPGYAHHSVAGGLWAANGDRFAGAVLLAEMLGWCDERVRAAAWGESYLQPGEEQSECQRYAVLRGRLHTTWGQGVADLLERAWRATLLSECPTLSEWLLELPGPAPTGGRPSPALAPEAQPVAARGPTAGEARQPRPLKPEEEPPTEPPSRKGPPASESRLAALPPEQAPRSYPSRPASLQIGPEEVLLRLFDQGLAALQAGRLAEAAELLSEVERRQPGFEQAGRKAADLLAQCRPRPVSPEPKGAGHKLPAWLPVAGAVAALVLIIVALRGCPGPIPTPAPAATAPGAAMTHTQVAGTHTAAVMVAITPSDTPSPTVTPTSTATPAPAPDAVVQATSAEMREGPSSVYALVKSYERGTALVVLGRSPGQQWLKVQAPDGVVGWIRAEYLTVNLTLADLEVGSAPASPTPKAPQAGATRPLGSTGITLVYVPAGTYWMGTADSDPVVYSDEKPRHQVELNGFWIGQAEVTNAQYRQFLDAGGYSTRSYWSDAGWSWKTSDGVTQPEYWGYSKWNGADQPVVGVSWYEAKAYAKWAGGRLPTEAEWEAAARGGPLSKGYTYAGSNEVGSVAWYHENSRGVTHAVKGKAPNELGLYDMSGNVREWVADWYGESYY